MKLVAHLLLFQLGWFACVLGAAKGSALAGPLVVALVALANRYLLPVRGEWPLLVGSLLLGAVVDSFLAGSGLVVYARNPAPAWLAPPWILAMWANFALTLKRSLAWLAPRPFLAAMLGAVFGPLAYLGGEGLGAIALPLSSSVFALALVWGAAVPLLGVASLRVGTESG